jgi:hypothetical protein
MFSILFVFFLAGAVWLFSRGQSTGGTLATVVAVLDGGAAVALYLRSRRNRLS